jgi:hypothetical protein
VDKINAKLLDGKNSQLFICETYKSIIHSIQDSHILLQVRIATKNINASY